MSLTGEELSTLFVTLNLKNSISNEMHNKSLNELKGSLASLGQFVIVGKFANNKDEDDDDEQNEIGAAPISSESCNTKVFEDDDYEIKLPETSPSDEITESELNGVENKVEKELPKEKRPHDEKIFNLSCHCKECLKHRETIIQLYLEDHEFNLLWERLQQHLLTFYNIIPESPDSPVHKKYKELMEKSKTKWMSDGSLDLQNNFRLSINAYLPLTDEKVFQLLCDRDPHQLFELICIQMQAVVLAYTEKLKNILKYNAQKEIVDYNPSELLNYIFDGYSKICQCEKMLSTIFFKLEAGHLLQFNLSLSQVYKRMYHRWIYLELQKLVPQCIIKLKELEYDENHTVLVQKFIKFDDAMTTVTETWRDIWLLIHHYHKSKDDIARRRRIATIHSIFQMIRESDFDFEPEFMELLAKDMAEDKKPLVDWITNEKRNDVWQYVLHNIKNTWIPCTHPRITAQLVSENCSKCKSPYLPHFFLCNCRSCIIAGGPVCGMIKENGKNSMCTKCVFFEKIMNGIAAKRTGTFALGGKDEASAAKNGSPPTSPNNAELQKPVRNLYHLSWAVFKHLPDRQAYPHPKLDPALFCVFREIPCTRYACRIAANIISQTYPLHFSKFLVKNYRPLDDATRKRIMSLQMDVNTIKSLDTKASDIFSSNNSKKLHPLHVTDNKWANDLNGTADENEESIKKASALAEGFLVDFPMPQKNDIFTIFCKLFRIHDQDIHFNVDQLDHIKKPRENSKIYFTIETTTTTTKNRDGTSDQLEDINVRMNNLKLMNKTREKRDCSETTTDPDCKCNPADAIMDGEIKKPLVEAIQLAASNKKLEAELRSLQKEHSMLKDMVRDLEHIHEEKHQCNHSADESSDSRESKSSHRTEGQCICYYCTIFGQNDCSHNSRVNETRDRLRKRLKNMQAKSTTNNTSSSNATTTTTTTTTSSNTKQTKQGTTIKEILTRRTDGAYTTKVVKTQEINGKNGKRMILQQTTTQISSKVQMPPQQTQTKQVKVVQSPKIVTPPPPPPPTQHDTHTHQHHHHNHCSHHHPTPQPQQRPQLQQQQQQQQLYCDEGVSVQKVTPINTAPVDDILKYIEGDAAKREKEALAAKKAAKKKQKQRKLEQKKTSELDDLKSQYDELCVEEEEIRKSLKLLKKRKNKNRLIEAETKLEEMSNEKYEKLDAADKIIQTMRKLNPNFNYDFGEELPSEVEKREREQKQMQTPPPPPQIVTQQTTMDQQNCEISVDPSKRMVTIRRINLPHAEPQVTVTAKGASPDKDQLLYTFINGQLVPASPTNQQLLQKIKNQYISNCTANYLNNKEGYFPMDDNSTKSTENKSNKNVKKPNSIEMQKIQQAIQKQQQKALEKEGKKQNSNSNNSNNKNNKNVQEKDDAKKNNNKNNSNKATTEVNNKKDTKKKPEPEPVKKSKRQMKRERRQESIESNNKGNNKESKESKEKSKSPVTVVKKEDEPKSAVVPVEKRKEKPKRAYIDPEFDNNAFKLLNIDDSETSDVDSNISEHETETPVEMEKQEVNIKEKGSQKNSVQNAKKQETVTNAKKNERKQSVDSVASSTQQKSRKNSLQQQQPVPNGKGSNKGKGQAQAATKGNNSNKKGSETATVTQKSQTSVPQMTKVNGNSDNYNQKSNGVSIMEQLSRGVRVEGLTLPPGITLTRVDPSTCENIKAKKESINRISQPMSSIQQQQEQVPKMMMAAPPLHSQYPYGNPIASNSDSSYMMVNPVYGMPMPPQDNIIMVDTPQLNGNHGADATSGNNKNKRTGKKKNKKGSNDDTDVGASQKKDGIVTLKNPLFDSVVTPNIKKGGAGPPGRNPQMPFDHPAAIIKQENGMFTIRNPILQQAMSQGQTNPLPHYSATYGNLSATNTTPSNMNGQCYDVPYVPTESTHDGMHKKCNSVIGSEIKTAHQIKQAQQKEQHQQNHWGDASTSFNTYGTSNKCYSPFEGQGGIAGGFNSDFVGRTYTGGHDYSQNYFTPKYSTTSRNFSPELPSNHHSSYYGEQQQQPQNGGGSASTTPSKYDDTNFLQSLQPGQRLNSEVTIHNINEAKFLREQQAAEANGIEITRIHGTDGSQDPEMISLSELLKNSSLYQQNPNLFATATGVDASGNNAIGDFSDNIFGTPYYDNTSVINKQSNQKSTMCLNRAPGSNKPTKQSDSPSSSSLFTDFPSSISMSSSNTPPSTDDPLADFVTNSDPIFYESKHGPSGCGVIGGEIKAVHSGVE